MLRPCPYGHPPYRGRCPPCEKARDRRRGTATQRGYDAEHRVARNDLRQYLPALCGYGCGTLLYPDGEWVAAHVIDGNPNAGWLASCRRCNERAKLR